DQVPDTFAIGFIIQISEKSDVITLFFVSFGIRLEIIDIYSIADNSDFDGRFRIQILGISFRNHGNMVKLTEQFAFISLNQIVFSLPEKPVIEPPGMVGMQRSDGGEIVHHIQDFGGSDTSKIRGHTIELAIYNIGVDLEKIVQKPAVDFGRIEIPDLRRPPVFKISDDSQVPGDFAILVYKNSGAVSIYLAPVPVTQNFIREGKQISLVIMGQLLQLVIQSKFVPLLYRKGEARC